MESLTMPEFNWQGIVSVLFLVMLVLFGLRYAWRHPPSMNDAPETADDNQDNDEDNTILEWWEKRETNIYKHSK